MIKNKFKVISVILLLIITAVTCIHPIFPQEQILQHLGTLLLLLLLFFDIKRDYLSNFSFLCLSLFALLHIIAARYIYSYVPYNEWFKSLFQIDLNTIFQAKRNHFDRFVHFSFGLLVFPFLFEIFDRKNAINLMLKIFVVWSFIQTFSMIYEIFEWSLTLLMTSESADYYNGQQGDIWDAQKDMVFAMFGSTIMDIIYFIKGRKANSR